MDSKDEIYSKAPELSDCQGLNETFKHALLMIEQLRDRAAGATQRSGQLVECGRKRISVECTQVALTEECLGGEDRRINCGRSVHKRCRNQEWL